MTKTTTIKLLICYLPDLNDDYDDTNTQHEGFWYGGEDRCVVQDPKIYPPYADGCYWEISESPLVGERVQDWGEFYVLETVVNGVDVCYFYPKDGIELELVRESLYEEDEQRDFWDGKYDSKEIFKD